MWFQPFATVFIIPHSDTAEWLENQGTGWTRGCPWSLSSLTLVNTGAQAVGACGGGVRGQMDAF